MLLWGVFVVPLYERRVAIFHLAEKSPWEAPPQAQCPFPKDFVAPPYDEFLADEIDRSLLCPLMLAFYIDEACILRYRTEDLQSSDDIIVVL